MGNLLRQSIEASAEAFSIVGHDRAIHGLWGHGHFENQYAPTQTGMGFIWLMTDDECFKGSALKITRTFRRSVIPYLDKLYSAYGNFVHSKNLVHIRWLLGVGFKSIYTASHNGEAFSLYLRESPDYTPTNIWPDSLI